MEQLNTHYYDTHIKSIYKELCILQNTYVLNENLFNELYESLEQIIIVNGSKDTIKEMLKLIQNDSNNNYDSANDIQTIDILDRTWAFVKKLPLEDRIILFEQIAEIKNGPCSQGRTTRIFQIYYSFF
jgi:hypothetical protein